MPRKRFDFNPIPQPAAPERDLALTASSDGSRALLQARLVPLERIIADPEQPRRTFPPESLQGLADSLRAQGMRQPITAFYDDSRACFVVISGERRLRAATIAGLTELPVLVEHRPGSEADKLVLQLAENLVREDLAPLEAARALGRLKELRPKDWLEVAARHGFGRRRSYQFLDLLTDPEPLRDALERGSVKEGHVAELRRAPADSQIRLLREVVAHGLSVADTRVLIALEQQRHARIESTPGAETAPVSPPDIHESLETRPAETGPTRLGATAGDIAQTIQAGGGHLPENRAQPPSIGAQLVEEKTRRERSRRLRQRLERIATELRNMHVEEVAAEYTSLPEIIVQARQARESLDAFIELLERVRLDRAGAMEQPPV